MLTCTFAAKPKNRTTRNKMLIIVIKTHFCINCAERRPVRHRMHRKWWQELQRTVKRWANIERSFPLYFAFISSFCSGESITIHHRQQAIARFSVEKFIGTVSLDFLAQRACAWLHGGTYTIHKHWAWVDAAWRERFKGIFLYFQSSSHELCYEQRARRRRMLEHRHRQNRHIIVWRVPTQTTKCIYWMPGVWSSFSLMPFKTWTVV